ncbi:MAG: hypothetical protein OER21_08875 [Gemmatimonadota bacterium]|nr:hypothetical protein [Gemmatimonadota bacterium]
MPHWPEVGLNRCCGVGVALVLLALGMTSPALAQDTVALRRGDRVRVTLPRLPARTQPRLWTGVLLAFDTAVIRLERRVDTVRIPLDSILQLERSLGRGPDHRLPPAGGALGLILGFVVGQAKNPFRPDPEPLEIGAVTVIGGLVGVAIGAVIGTQVRRDHWEVVPLPRR